MSKTYELNKRKYKNESDTKGSYSNSYKLREQERDYKNCRDNYDQKTKALFFKAQESLNEYGQNDFRTQLLFDFLYMVDEMNESIKLLESTQAVFQVVGSAIGTIDSIMNLNMSIVTNSLGVNYGFFERLKRKRTIKKAMRNNINRMNAMITQIQLMTEMGEKLSESMSKSFRKMKVRMEKSRIKRMKKKNAVNVSSTVDVYNKFSKIYNSPSTATDPTKPTVDPKPSGKEGNIDDIV